MKFLPALGLLPLVLMPLACSSAPAEQTGANSAAIAGGSCTSSRDDLLASASAARRHAMERGFAWLDESVPYSQSKSFEGYRTDCSGFVSMCWELGTSTTTAVLFGANQYASDLGSWDDLLPADALVHNGHVVLFLGWEPDKSGVCVLEQASTASDMQFRVRSVASLQSQSFKPIRASVLADDTAVATDVSAPPATDTSTSDTSAPVPPAASDAPPPTDPSAPPPSDPADPGTCVSPADLDVCNEALLTRNIGCGTVVDGCGKTVNCDAVAGFGCKNGEKCNATSHQCAKGAPPPPPPPAATAPPAPETPPISAQEGTVPPQGDPGDDGSSAPAAPGVKGPKASTSDSALPGTAGPSGGCSVSSSKSAGRAGGDALPLIAFAVAVSLAQRRRRRS
jgi:hypothetical protein